jgi:alkaline phosphatase
MYIVFAMENISKREFKILVSIISIGLVLGAVIISPNLGIQAQDSTIKNVIVLVPDGCSQSIQTLSRWYSNGSLTLDEVGVSGTVKTYMSNSIITGSAAAATAFATGNKTTVRFLSVGPRPDDFLTGFTSTVEPYAPIATVLEGAKSKVKATGMIATSRITHATPAAYGCHIHDRGMDNEIMEHLVYQEIDVVFGGGFRHLIPEGTSYTTTFGKTWNGRRTDGEDLHVELLSRGYQFVDNKDDMVALTSGRVWGMFDDSHTTRYRQTVLRTP